MLYLLQQLHFVSVGVIHWCVCVCGWFGGGGMHLAGALWSHHLPCNIAQARGHVVRQVEFSRPHWPVRGPELTEGSVFPSAFAFRKAELGSVSTGLIYSCVSFFGKQ